MEQMEENYEAILDQKLNLCDFFDKFAVEEKPFIKKCIYCKFLFGKEHQRFRWHIAGIEKQGARICRNAPVQVTEAAVKLLTSVRKNSEPHAISSAVRGALLSVGVEIESLNAPHQTGEAGEVEGFISPSATEEPLFRGLFSLSAESAALLENALARYPDLWTPDKPELLILPRYKILLDYLSFIKDYKGLNLDDTEKELLNEHAEKVIHNGFDKGSVYAMLCRFRNNRSDPSYVDTRRAYEEQFHSLHGEVMTKRKELKLLEKKESKAWKKLRDYEARCFEF